MGDPLGLLIASDFYAMLGQLQYTTKDQFAQTSVTSVATVECLAFFGEVNRSLADPARTETFAWTCVLANSFMPQVGQVLATVVDSLGTVIVSYGRITEVRNFEDWHRQGLFKQVILSVN